jgi:hypothetical protein
MNEIDGNKNIKKKKERWNEWKTGRKVSKLTKEEERRKNERMKYEKKICSTSKLQNYAAFL